VLNKPNGIGFSMPQISTLGAFRTENVTAELRRVHHPDSTWNNPLQLGFELALGA
jgi:hypothetical protein